MLIPFKSYAPALPVLSVPQVSAITSDVAPWVSCWAYPVGRHLVLPAYFGSIEVTGREHLPTAGSVILAPTHRSRWDAFMVPYAAGRDITGRELRFMVSANEMKGFQGWFIRKFGGFPVDTKQPSISSLRHGVELLRQGETLVIFPEGNIFRDRETHRLKPGLARLAVQAETSQPGLNIKVVPIHIEYDQPYPQWRSRVKIDIGQPLSVTDYIQGGKQGAQQLTSDLEVSFKALQAQA